jgi:hypothetical protein
MGSAPDNTALRYSNTSPSSNNAIEITIMIRSHRQRRIRPTLIRGPNGAFSVGGLPKSYTEGLGSLIDLFPAGVRVEPLPAGATTRIAFERVGAALRNAMAMARAKDFG